MNSKHKIFISFHHNNENDKDGGLYRNAFESLIGDEITGIETNAIHEGDINPDLPEAEIKDRICNNFIKDTHVTVVLIGPATFCRKYIDWEISASLRTRPDGYPSGLLGIILPEHPEYLKEKVDPATIPARLTDNLTTGFATLCHWTLSVHRMVRLIQEAAHKRKRYHFDDSRSLLNFDLDPRSRIHYKEKKYVSLSS
ncbi:MAG: TIR domain-containing protein [Cyclobacteriaceae bacterium]